MNITKCVYQFISTKIIADISMEATSVQVPSCACWVGKTSIRPFSEIIKGGGEDSSGLGEEKILLSLLDSFIFFVLLKYLSWY